MASPEVQKLNERDLDRIADQIESQNSRLVNVLSGVYSVTARLWPTPDGEKEEECSPVPCGMINRLDFGLEDLRDYITKIEKEVARLQKL